MRRIHWYLLGGGLLLGLVNVTANYGLFPGAVYISKLVGNSWGWLAASFLAAWGGASWPSATKRSLFTLLPAIAAYYLFDYILAEQVTGTGSSKSPAIVIFWTIAALVVSAAIGGLTRLVRRRTWISVPAAAALPAFVSYGAFDAYGFLSQDPWMDRELLQVTRILWPVAAGVAFAVAVIRIVALTSRTAAHRPGEHASGAARLDCDLSK